MTETIADIVVLDMETGKLYTGNEDIRERIEFVFSENKRYREALKRIRNRGILLPCSDGCDCARCIAKRALEG